MNIACFICLANYEAQEEIVSINKCGHVFHMQCLNEWKKSRNELSNCCPTCRKPYTKRSLTRLFLGITEPDRDFQKDIEKLEEEKKKENLEKNLYMNELVKIKTEYGVKCQAYSIIDTVNNEYLQYNLKLKAENERLLEQTQKIKNEMESMMKKLSSNKPPISNGKLVDLTSEEISDDDEIEIVSTFTIETSSSKKTNDSDIVIEINDDDEDEVQIVNNNNDDYCANDEEQYHSIQPVEVANENIPLALMSSTTETNEQSDEKSQETEQAINNLQKCLYDFNSEPPPKKTRIDDDDDDGKDGLGNENFFKILHDFLSDQM